MIRLGGGGHALATTVEPEASPTEIQNAACAPQVDTFGLLDDLRAREDRLRQREGALDDRKQALALARTEIDGKLAALERAEAELSATLTIADQAADQDVARLVAVYEKMKPKDAASLFGAMEPDFAAGFLGRMRPETAATVLAGLAPDKAYAISVVLAGRNANAPRN